MVRGLLLMCQYLMISTRTHGIMSAPFHFNISYMFTVRISPQKRPKGGEELTNPLFSKVVYLLYGARH